MKPQFELGPGKVDARGAVRDDADCLAALAGVREAASALGLSFVASADSRVPGPEGNREIFAVCA